MLYIQLTQPALILIEGPMNLHTDGRYISTDLNTDDGFMDREEKTVDTLYFSSEAK